MLCVFEELYIGLLKRYLSIPKIGTIKIRLWATIIRDMALSR
jgi:hypothetical protein